MTPQNIIPIALAYTGVVMFLMAGIMQTAKKKKLIDVAFISREWFLSSLFLLTGFLVLLDIPRDSWYRTYLTIGLSSVNTLVLFSIVRSNLPIRRPKTIIDPSFTGALDERQDAREVHQNEEGENLDLRRRRQDQREVLQDVREHKLQNGERENHET